MQPTNNLQTNNLTDEQNKGTENNAEQKQNKQTNKRTNNSSFGLKHFNLACHGPKFCKLEINR